MRDLTGDSRADHHALVVNIATRLTFTVDWEKPLGPLYHYTSAGGCLGILRSRCIWATHYAFLNDRSELAHGDKIVAGVAKGFAAGKPGFQTELWQAFAHRHKRHPLTTIADVYIASFSEVRDQLSQWRAYAARGDGYSLGFEALPRHEPTGYFLTLQRVRYDEEEAREEVKSKLSPIPAEAENVLQERPDIDKALLVKATVNLMYLNSALLVPAFKDGAFAEEREWRLAIASLDPQPQVQFRQDNLAPYLAVPLCAEGATQLPLVELLAGPAQDSVRSQKAGELLLAQLGYRRELMKCSRIPFRG